MGDKIIFMLKKLKPTSPGQRHTVLLEQKFLSKVKKTKKSTKSFKNSSGRNNLGRITITSRGSGNKTKYVKLDFVRRLTEGTVVSIEYDSNRTANIAKLYSNGKTCYILAPVSLKIGDKLYSGPQASFRQIGNHLPLKNIPIGTLIHNIELKKGKGGQIARSAGTSGRVLSKANSFVKILLNSGKEIIVSENLSATIGIVSNELAKFKNIGKAGRNRWLNKRPHVRGVAKNHVDHPNGGGEGKTSGGRPSVTPYGIITKNKPTRRKNKKRRIFNG